MTLLASRSASPSDGSGALYGIGLAIVLAFAYWLLTTFFMAVGGAGSAAGRARRLGRQHAVPRGGAVHDADGAHVSTDSEACRSGAREFDV